MSYGQNLWNQNGVRHLFNSGEKERKWINTSLVHEFICVVSEEKRDCYEPKYEDTEEGYIKDTGYCSSLLRGTSTLV